ncbi:MAG: hypothetical protein ACD_16C00100G0032 [uncultured bacterium]|nr:MAG: hypothetical protein ACD_16C00100G0032 [uncultured bacterium]HBG34073.1 hypothetical protein [Holosporales bacterium]HBW25369.1 hypothetical protein [Holosporales bacterium]HCE96008.1 hypothetical protein [Holosporales bacterium]
MISFSLLLKSLLFVLLGAISVQDIRKGLIPDSLVLGIIVLGLFQVSLEKLPSVVILGMIGYAFYIFYPLLRGKEGLGLGDVKMMVASGLWILPSQIPLFLFMTGLGGLMLALLWKVLEKGPKFPLGPALAFALGICIVGEQGLSEGENKMITTFSGPQLTPASGGPPDSIVVFLHGYGANGHDLLSIGNAWAALLPNTLFVAPHGPLTSKLYPSGNQWFSLDDWNPDQPLTTTQIARMLGDIQAITPSFNRYLDTLLKTHDLSPEKLAFVGFSQGSMFALYMALHRPRCAGVVAYSGAFLEDSTKSNISRPPILLIHGREDRLVPPSFSQIAEKRLKTLQVPVTLALIPGLDHGIDEKGLALGGAFLKERLYENTAAALSE